MKTPAASAKGMPLLDGTIDTRRKYVMATPAPEPRIPEGGRTVSA